jgi:hypothetical protein
MAEVRALFDSVKALSCLFLPDNSIDDERHDGSESRDENPTEIKGLDFPETHEAPEKTTDDSTDDPDEDGDEDSTRVFAGHDEFSKCSGDEAEEYPR